MFWKISASGLAGLDALDVAAGEFADERDIHAADKADLAGFRGHRREQADEIGALMLLEDDRLHVRQFDDHVDDREFQVRELGRDLLQGGGLREANGDDRRMAIAGEAAQGLLDLGVVGRLEIAEVDIRLLLELLGADEDTLVEGFIELAALVVDDRRLDRLRLRQCRHSRKRNAGERRRERTQTHGSDPLS
jgi:hypothetical protein